MWTLAAWCELRNDFRNFRVDRIANAVIADRSFADEPGKTLADFISRVVKDWRAGTQPASASLKRPSRRGR